jgi:hypothetical protein
MKELKQEDVIRIMREEWHKKVSLLEKEIDVALEAELPKKGDTVVIAPELKVMHKKSGIRYTVQSVGPRDCILRTPEGETFLVDAQELESEYKLD